MIDSYLGFLLHNGQLCREYFYTWTDKILNAHVTVSHPAAFELKYHPDWGIKRLNEVIHAFGHEPKWILLDDDIPKKLSDYKNSPFLYLRTSAYRLESSIRRGDNGKRISPIMLPVSSQINDDIYGWERVYRQYDRIWLDCGVFEIPVYKQLADPKSELSDEGRQICSAVEEATGVPTYYYLMRYWCRKTGENQRRCPACGNKWRVEPKK